MAADNILYARLTISDDSVFFAISVVERFAGLILRLWTENIT
jgi:hypothetical protein